MSASLALAADGCRVLGYQCGSNRCMRLWLMSAPRLCLDISANQECGTPQSSGKLPSMNESQDKNKAGRGDFTNEGKAKDLDACFNNSDDSSYSAHSGFWFHTAPPPSHREEDMRNKPTPWSIPIYCLGSVVASWFNFNIQLLIRWIRIIKKRCLTLL